MIVVIIAGGAGTRLWPLSTSRYPKHLLTLNGDSKTLLQRTYERAKALAGSEDRVYVVSEVGHISHVQEQLAELAADHFIIEPARRGTASCLAATLIRLKATGQAEDEVVAFIPADHYIRDNAGFIQSFRLAEYTAQTHRRITLVGVDPDYAATGFGYIQKGEPVSNESFAYSVQSFREKPDHTDARQYLNSGNYLWNCSYHLGTIDMFEVMLQHSAPKLHKNYLRLAAAKTPAEYKDVYLQFETTSIEYAVTEKAQNLLVVAGTFDWLDIGSFADMSKAVGSDEEGNFKQGLIETEEVENSFLQNTEDKPIAIIGLNNLIVVNSPNGLLIARKDQSQKVGEVSKRLRRER